MARRSLSADPMSRLATWALRLAVFAFVAALLSIVVVRSGLLEIRPAVVTFLGTLAIAAVAILLALGSLIGIWNKGLRGLGRGIAAMAIGGALLAYPAYLGVYAYRQPWINDVTTDAADPPRFEALARVRPRDANPVDYPGATAAAVQTILYPDIEPYFAETTPQAVYDAALGVINKRRWRVVDDRPPQAGRGDGHIEAVARTAIMGFRDDVVLRVRATPGGTRLDVRSASRYGPLDFGGNASRVRALLENIEEALNVKRPVAPPVKAAPATAKRSNQADKR